MTKGLGTPAGESPFRPYLPEHLAARLVAGDFPPPGVPERLEGAVLFSDVSGFTPLSEALTRLGREGAERLTRILNRHFARMVEVVEAHGGSVVKYGGDAMTVLFAGEGETRRAVRCGAAMQRAIREYAEVAVPELGESFSIRMKIGIDAGGMTQLVVGEAEREFVLAGEPVDAMAEAEHHAAAGEVVATARAAERAAVGDWSDAGDGFRRLEGHEGEEPPRAEAAAAEGSDLLFEPFLPPAIAERIRAGASGLSVGEHRPVTTIFLLFRGLDYDGDPEAFRKLQQYYLSASATVRRFGGRVNRLITGDKGSLLHILFGAPLAHEDDEARALLAALELRDARLPFDGTQSLGVNTGGVFCGNLGSDRRQEYTVMGDAVNLAARLMQAAGAGTILCSEATRRRSKGAIRFRELDPIRVKGKSEPVAVAEVVGEEAGGEARGSERSDLPFVGRQAELRRALDVAARALGGSGGRLHVEGEAGSGKSRFVDAMLAALPSGVAKAVVRPASWTGDVPLFPWRRIVEQRLAVGPETPDAERRRRLSEVLGLRLTEGSGDAEMLGAALGWWRTSAPASPEEEEIRRKRLFSTLQGAVLAAREPLVVVLEDLHRVDDSSRSFLDFLVSGIEGEPVLIVSTARPDDRSAPAATATEEVDRIDLGPMDRRELGSLLGSLLEEGVADPEVLDLVAARGRGNPMFSTELVRLLLAGGGLCLEPESRRWYLAPGLPAGSLPENVHALLLSRIDRLSQRARRVLNLAAVFGSEVEEGALAPLVASRPDDRRLGTELAELESAGLMRRQGSLLAFENRLVQEVAYESLGFEERRELHGRIGRRLEEALGDGERGSEEAPRLARHFVAARDGVSGWKWSRLAAERAQVTYANEEVARHLTNALELSGVGVERSEEIRRQRELLPTRGKALKRLGRLEEAFRDHRKSFELAIASRDLRAAGEACLEMSEVEEVRGDYRVSLALARSAGRFAGRAGWADGGVKARTQIGVVLWRMGRTAESVATFEAFAPEDWASPEAGRSLLSYGIALRSAGYYPRAEAVLLECVRLAGVTGDRFLEVSGELVLAALHEQQNHFEEGARHLERADRAARVVGDFERRARVLNSRGTLATRTGEDRAAEAFFLEANYLARRLRLHDLQSVVLSNLGVLAFGRGRFDDALEHYREAASLVSATGSPDAVLFRANIAEVLIAKNAPEAEASLLGIAVGAELVRADVAIWARTELGKLLRSRGETESAREEWRLAVELARSRGLETVAEEASRLLEGR